ncbi:MAG: cell division protein ZapE [Pseudohongiellaceae bacterium]
MDPLTRYSTDIATNKITPDAAQQQVVGKLQELWLNLSCTKNRWAELKYRLGMASPPPRGIYLWGGVGRGKTYLMDLLYDCIPGQRKQRTHFHRFMQSVHGQLTHLQGTDNPLEKIADRLSRSSRILCFDEFFVDDIGDAMLLAELLRALFARRVCLVATSNNHPDNLYANGLQRQRFLPAIALLHTHTEVIELVGNTDYRLRSLSRARLYHCPPQADADNALLNLFNELTPDGTHSKQNHPIEILGRQIHARHCADDIVWFDFTELCDTPRSAFDYVELARLYHSLIISNIPLLDDTTTDQTRRLINLVDALYDRRVKLIISAAAPPNKLYQGQALTAEFKRTHSRLLEMQSHAYLAAASGSFKKVPDNP